MLFALEAALMLIPTVLLFSRRVRENPAALYFMALLVLFGFIANRLNVSITGMEGRLGSALHTEVDGSGHHIGHLRAWIRCVSVGGFELAGV
jgi:Ni/Fe-hydrogenase subunit HybB-like protein